MRADNSVLFMALLAIGMSIVPTPGLFSPASAAEIVIDDFSIPGDGSWFFAPGHSDWGSEYPVNPYQREDTINGDTVRKLLLEVDGVTPVPFAAAGYLPDGELHVATFGHHGARLHLEYLFDENAPKDLIDGSNVLFLVELSSIDAGFGDKLDFIARVTGQDGTVAEYYKGLGECVVTTRFEVPFAEFTSSNGDPMDAFRNAVSIVFKFNDPVNSRPMPNVDFAILGIVAVPEPSGTLLIVPAFMAAAGLRPTRRQRGTREVF